MLRLIRPTHWVKNVFVLIPLVTAGLYDRPEAWLAVLLATVSFSLVAGGVYAINDIVDRGSDRLHPRKKDRPLAAGRIQPSTAALLAAAVLTAGLALGALVNWLVLLTLGTYVLLQMAYTAYLKGKMFLDVICVAMGFVLRAVAGATALAVAISPWLFVCTFTLCLFLGFCKRSNEAATLREGAPAREHRLTLAGYTPELLTHLITLSAGIAVVAFLLYASSPRTVEHFGTNYLIYTLPLMVYAIFRFAMLSMKAAYADPTDLIIRDRPFQLTVLLWALCAMAIVHWGDQIRTWAEGLIAPTG